MSGTQETSSKKKAASTSRRRKRRMRDGKTSSAYRTISEVADELNVAQHVLRFWETKFKELEPLKRGGGRRYYRPDDVVLLKKIHNLLYTQGFTIKGVQKLLRKDKSLAAVSCDASAGSFVLEGNNGHSVSDVSHDPSSQDDMDTLPPQMRKILAHLLDELKELRSLV